MMDRWVATQDRAELGRLLLPDGSYVVRPTANPSLDNIGDDGEGARVRFRARSGAGFSRAEATQPFSSITGVAIAAPGSDPGAVLLNVSVTLSALGSATHELNSA